MNHRGRIALPIFIIVAAVAGAALFFGRDAQAQGSKDGLVIAELRKAGSNLSKPHPVEFFFYLPTREAAERVAAKVRASGFSVKQLDRAAAGPDWLVLATKTLVVTEAEMVKLRKEFDALAKVEKGEYDGWGTPVVR